MMRLCPIKYGVKFNESSDPFSSYVVFLLHFDGADGSTVFTDETGKIWAGSPASYITTDEKKFGTGSFYSSGGTFNPTYVETSDAYFATNPIGTQDFCLECFVWVDAGYDVSQGNRGIMGFNTSTYAFGITHNKDAGTNGRFSGYIVSGGNEIFGDTTYPNKEQWYHIAMTRSGNTLRLFVDGISQGTKDVTGSSIAAATQFYIGDIFVGASYIPFYGRIDEARLTVGVPRYTSNFTPPTAEFPYP